jgi:hypothetical protein
VVLNVTSESRNRILTIVQISSVGVLFLTAIALRYVFIFRLNPPSEYVFSDMAGFVNRAQHILDRRFLLDDTLFPPGQHLLIAASGLLFDGHDTLVLWTHLIAGVLTCYFVWKGAEIYLGKRASLIALVACTFHFPFIALGGYYLAETVFTALLALLFFLTARASFPWTARRAVCIGIVAALGLIWKGNNVFFLPLLALWSAGWCLREDAGMIRKARLCWCFLLLGFTLVIGGQFLYFYRLYGVALPIAAGGAYNFALDKCPGSRIIGKGGRSYQSPRTYYTGEGGIQAYDRYFHEESYFWKVGLKCVAKRPWVLLTSFKNIYYLFYGNQLWPVNNSPFGQLSWFYQLGFALLIFPGLAMSSLLIARSPFSPTAVPFLLCVSICASSWFFPGEMRFRIPFDVVFIPMGIMGWKAALAVLRGARLPTALA